MRLTDVFMEIIAYTGYVVTADPEFQPSYEQVSANLQRLITQSEAELENSKFSYEDYDLARFAVFAWVDETMLASPWPGRQQWQRELLQRQYYQTTDAGELFFERLNGLGPHQRDVREVYFLCLALGFTGQYCHEGDDFLLEQLRTSNLKLLTGSSMGLPSLESGDLFPEAYIPADADVPSHLPKQKRFSIFTLACAAAPVALYGLLYFIYRFILSNIGETLISTVP